ncbi:hypothetical protein BC826DRAFT_85942 [Russula brevipes]|nr:hypothetical protein BC826DRAFT_85942 [Russula brevipes]
MDPTDHDDIVWLHTHLTGQVNGLSTIYEHISFAIRQLQDEKTELQNRVDELEQSNPSAEVRRLREENTLLRARLATAAKEKSEVISERDALLRKLNGVKQLLDGPAFDGRDVGTDAQSAESVPHSVSSTVRPQNDRRARPSRRPSGPAAELMSPARTEASEPKTDVTVMHDTFGRILRSEHPWAASVSGAAQASQPLSAHTSATLTDTWPRSQHAPRRAADGLFVDTRAASSLYSVPQTPPTLRALNADLIGSPQRRPLSTSRVLSLHSSPGMSEGISVQYDATPQPGPGLVGTVTTAATATATRTAAVQKWRIHFAKPPTSATAVALPKPVPTAALVQKLELDEEARRSIDGLSSGPAGTLRLYICDASESGLAFLYDPVLLESQEATYVVEWSETKASQNTRAYIQAAKEKHTDLHTFIYAPRKNGWHYLGQQRWGLTEIKSIWNSLTDPAQRALATRSFKDDDPDWIKRGLEEGKIEQLTIELQQVSLMQPNAGEALLLKKLRN